VRFEKTLLSLKSKLSGEIAGISASNILGWVRSKGVGERPSR